MMKKYISMAVAATVAVAAFGTSCKKEKEDKTPLLLALAAINGTKSATINFSLYSGSTPVNCSSSSFAIDGTHTAATVQDARFYVSNVKLVTRSGGTISVNLDANNFQNSASGVGFIDLEDATGNCATQGSAETNAALSFSLPFLTNTADIVGLEFDVGIPDAANRFNYQSTSTTPPFDKSNMYWSWASAYKFTKLEVKDAGGSSALHLGSTGNTGPMASAGGCDGVTPAPVTSAVPGACLYLNRPTIRITSDSFVLGQSGVKVDLAALFQGVTWGSCMSGRSAGALAGACTRVFSNIGVSSDGTSSGTQNGVFSIL